MFRKKVATSSESERQPSPTAPLSDVVNIKTAEPTNSMNDERVKNARSNRRLRRWYAKMMLWVMVIQIAVADGIFLTYTWYGQHWKISVGVMQSWLAATVVQVIGTVLIITRGLFLHDEDERP